MDEKERLSALDVALNNEMRERAFYLKHAKRTKNPIGKAMFQQIADEELEHYDRLKELHEKWTKNETWPESLPLKVKDTVVKTILLDLVKGVDTAADKNQDDLEALKTAIDFEEKGADFYAKLRDAVTNPKEKAFFDLMSKIEREHYLSLKETEEYLADPVSWFTRVERSGLDGA